MKKDETILFVCAHNDDQIVGAGGSIARWVEQGARVKTIVFSFGEMSHPWLREEVTAKMRLEELRKSEKLLGIDEAEILNIKEGQFNEPASQRTAVAQIKKMIKNEHITKVFCHAQDDWHKDHRGVYQAVRAATPKKIPIYTFDVWNWVKVKTRNNPKLVVDVSGYFRKKIDAFFLHKSQKAAFFSLIWNLYAKAFFHGFRNDCMYAEVFYRVQ